MVIARYDIYEQQERACNAEKIAIFIGFLFESRYHSRVIDARFGICYIWELIVNVSNVITAVQCSIINW